MFKTLFLGYLFGIRSERQLVREIEMNVAYRWFLGLRLTDQVFDASTLSQNRRRRYQDSTVAQAIFDRIVEQAIAHGLVDGTVLYTDSTHLKANANKNRYDKAVIAYGKHPATADGLRGPSSTYRTMIAACFGASQQSWSVQTPMPPPHVGRYL
jgi:hypothetical protein